MWEGERLIIPRKVARAMVTHAVNTMPREMCGVLIGWGGVNAQYWIPIPNIHSEPEYHYQMDPEAQVLAWEWAEKRDLRIIGIVHSHVNTDAVMSMADLEYAAFGPDMFYVVLGLNGGGERSLRAWEIDKTAERTRVVNHPVVIDQGKRGLVYCPSHNKYEDDLRSFKVCFECGHVFATELDLISAHNDVVEQINRNDPHPGARQVQKAEDVFCCPFCVHDF